MLPNSSQLPIRHRIGPVPRPRELRRAIRIPSKLLRPNRPRSPSIRRIQHPMIYDPILTPIWTCRKTRMSDPIRLLHGILVEDAALCILAPVLHVHGVIADELKLP